MTTMKKTLTFLALGAMMAIGARSNAQVLFSEDFETTTGTSLPTGWTQSVASGTPNDSVGWNSGSNATLGSSAFNMNANSPRFLGVNDDAHEFASNTNDLLMTPSYNLSTATSPYLSFDCCFRHGTYGGFTEAGTVEVSTNSGATWTVVSTLASNVSLWWEPRYISLAAYAGMSNVMIGFRYKDNTGWLYGFCIDNFKIFTPPTNDLGLTSIAPMTGTPASYAVTGGNISMSGNVFNYGATTVTSYNVNYQFNSGAVVSSPISGSIAPFTSASFTAPTPITLPGTLGAYPVRMWISLTGDVNHANDTSAMDTLNAVAFMPVKKLAIEEATGTWCGWCVRGIVYMDSLETLYGNGVSLIAVHNSDPMTVTAYDAYISNLVGSSYPNAAIDRTNVVDPGSLLTEYTAHHNDFGFADITATGTLTGTTALSVAVTVKPALNLNGDYRLILVLTEDNVHGSGSAWDQHNYYSSAANNLPLTGGGFNYQTAPSTLPASTMYYDHVGRSVSPTVTGTSGVLPAAMAASSTNNATLTATITAGWNINYMHGIVMLLDGASGHVLNSQNMDLTLGVSNVTSGVSAFSIYPNPANDQAFVSFELESRSVVTVQVTDMVGRIIASIPVGELTAGTQHVPVSTENMSAGLYNVRVVTETGSVTERLTVIK